MTHQAFHQQLCPTFLIFYPVQPCILHLPQQTDILHVCLWSHALGPSLTQNVLALATSPTW